MMIRTLILFGAAIWLTALAGLETRPAEGCGGTPPPFFCGQTYVFVSAGDLNVVADRAGAIPIDTLHYINKVMSGFGGCPPGSFTLVIDAALVAAPGAPGGGGIASTQTFGPFTVNEGFSPFTIDVALPSSSAGTYQLLLTGIVTDSGGNQLSQTSEQTICVLPPAPSDPNQPIINIQRIGDAIQRAHPSAGRAFDYLLTNNSSAVLDITVAATTKNAAVMPAWFGVVPTMLPLEIGPFAVSDPGSGDAYPLVFGDEFPDLCVPLPVAPHLAMPEEIQRVYRVQPGASMPVQLKTRSWPLCGNGSCNQGRVVASATIPATVAGIAGQVDLFVAAAAFFGMVADTSQPAEFNCPSNSGRAAFTTPGTVPGIGPAIRVLGDASTTSPAPFNVLFAYNPAEVQLQINGSPPDSASTFVVPDLFLEPQIGRMIAEKSFINPPFDGDDILTFITPVHVPAPPSGQTFAIDMLMVPDAAPGGFDDQAPFAKCRIDVQSTVPTVAPGVLDCIHQVSAIGVAQGTFEQVAMTNLSVDFEIVNPNLYVVTTTWRASDPGAGPMIGFDVLNDYRGVAMPPQPNKPPVMLGDLNGDGQVNNFDIDAFLLAVTDPTAFPGQYPDGSIAAGDFTGDGSVDGADVFPFVELLMQPRVLP